MQDLLEVESHFSFGKNWIAFLEVLDQERIDEAVRGMAKLFPNGSLSDVRFLDIGCGSGLSSLAAARLGAKTIDAVDIDPNSVQATTTLLAKLTDTTWTASVESVFELSTRQRGLYDVVYSWGVLHHTGDMWRAVKAATDMVKPGGYLAIALYRKTPLCGFWRREKRYYAAAAPIMQSAVSLLYKALYLAGLLATGRNPWRYLREYKSCRGMNWSHDVHDWLGGYPYESATPMEVRNFLSAENFSIVREFTHSQKLGLFGSGCDEFVAMRKQ